VAVIAERFEVRLAEGRTELGLAPAALACQPGSVPVDAVRGAIRGYQAGVITGERLISIVDRHGRRPRTGIAHKAVESMTDFHRAIDRAALLAGQMSMRLAQLEWLRRFPAGPDRDPVQLTCSVKSTEAGVPAAGGTDRSRAPGEIRPGDHRRRAARVPPGPRCRERPPMRFAGRSCPPAWRRSRPQWTPARSASIDAAAPVR